MDNDLKKFIDRYIERGFGSMNKNDFEVEIFHYLLQTNYFESTKDYEISRQLRIPQSKVKRLKYESELKYPEKNQDEKVKEILGNAKIYFDRECIVLSIELLSAAILHHRTLRALQLQEQQCHSRIPG